MTQVKIDEVLRLVCDITAKIPAHDAVPGGVILLVKLLKGEKQRAGQAADGDSGPGPSPQFQHVYLVVPAHLGQCPTPTLPPQPRASGLRSKIGNGTRPHQ